MTVRVTMKKIVFTALLLTASAFTAQINAMSPADVMKDAVQADSINNEDAQLGVKVVGILGSKDFRKTFIKHIVLTLSKDDKARLKELAAVLVRIEALMQDPAFAEEVQIYTFAEQFIQLQEANQLDAYLAEARSQTGTDFTQDQVNEIIEAAHHCVLIQEFQTLKVQVDSFYQGISTGVGSLSLNDLLSDLLVALA